MGGIVAELIDKYIQKNRKELQYLFVQDNLYQTMKMSESFFMEWNNDDEIYNEL